MGGQGLKMDVCPAGHRGHPWSARCGGQGHPGQGGTRVGWEKMARKTGDSGRLPRPCRGGERDT